MVLITFDNKNYDTDTTYKLDCSFTKKIKEIPAEFINLTHLNCEETKVGEIPSTLINLTYLNCKVTKIGEIPSTLINLTYLDCEVTKVREIPFTLINLTYLNCAYTKVGEIPSTLTNITYLNCEATKVKKIPSTFVNLIYLNCTDTYVKEIPSTLINIETLFVSGTKIKQISDKFINLVNLECDETQIRRIPSTLVNLKELSCDDTNVKCVPRTLVNLQNRQVPFCAANKDPYSKIKNVAKNKSSGKSKELTNELAQGFQTSKGCYTENEGVLCNMIDLEDTENHEYLSQDDDNVIFMISPNNDSRYYAYGYNKKELIHDSNTDVFYDCKRNPDGTYETSADEMFGRFNKEGKAYVKINLNNYPILVSSEELLAVIEDSTKKLFLLDDPTEKFLYTASYGVMFGGQDYVSADHCQRGTSKDVYTLYILE